MELEPHWIWKRHNHHHGHEELQKGFQGGIRRERERFLACAGWVDLGSL